MKKRLLTKAVLVSLTIATVAGGGVADAANRPAPTKKPTTTTTCDIDPASCTTVAAAGIRW